MSTNTNYKSVTIYIYGVEKCLNRTPNDNDFCEWGRRECVIHFEYTFGRLIKRLLNLDANIECDLFTKLEIIF